MQRLVMSALRISVVLILCAGVTFAGTTITIVHVNDTHSHLDAFGPADVHQNGTIGGIAKAAHIFGAIRLTEPNVVLLHGGDAFVGDFFFNRYFGAAELQIMSGLGFDAMAVGNHEFDLTPDVLLGSLMAVTPAPPPLLSANLDMSKYAGGTSLGQFIQPSIIIDRGVKIGIFGLTVWDNPGTNNGDVAIVDPIPLIALQTVQSLRSNGAAVIICLSHMGILHDQELAAAVPGIDVIVGAHDHLLLKEPVRVGSTLILQAGSFYMNVGMLHLGLDGGVVSFLDYTMMPVDGNVPAVPEIQAIVDGLKPAIVKSYGDVYHKVVGFARCDQEKVFDGLSQIRDTPMGDLVTDALRERGRTQLGLSALGLISEKIYAGAIVGSDVFRSVPYGYDPKSGLGFKLVRVRVDGGSLLQGIETTLAFLGVNDDYFPQVSGMTFRYDATKEIGSRVILSSVRVGGRPLNPFATYTMTVDEGAAGLLPMLGVIPTDVEYMRDLEYDVVKDYIHRRGVIAYRPEGRIRDVSVKCRYEHFAAEEAAMAEETEAPPAAARNFELGQNYPNPFNPVTTIRYALPYRTRTNVTVYNALGQIVMELVNEEQEAGYHDVRFNGTGLASGVYFYRLHAGNFTETKRLTLVK